MEMRSFIFKEAQDGKPSPMLPDFEWSPGRKDFNKQQMMRPRMRVKKA